MTARSYTCSAPVRPLVASVVAVAVVAHRSAAVAVAVVVVHHCLVAAVAVPRALLRLCNTAWLLLRPLRLLLLCLRVLFWHTALPLLLLQLLSRPLPRAVSRLLLLRPWTLSLHTASPLLLLQLWSCDALLLLLLRLPPLCLCSALSLLLRLLQLLLLLAAMCLYTTLSLLPLRLWWLSYSALLLRLQHLKPWVVLHCFCMLLSSV